MSEIEKQQDGRADFDFLLGRWRVHHRILRLRLQGSTDWQECEGTVLNYQVMGGLANVEEHKIEREDGLVKAIALRIYNPASQEWGIYWVDSKYTTLDNGVFGSFKEGLGTFYSLDAIEGKRILTRFIWSDITHDSARWEQACSADFGKTWEVNWTMYFSRYEEE
ncbi:DUF1579 domain-containing protein [Ktedonosporobacter rubrisoli]|uniref:DUF1579 domain-containing protein n=1 Tax=Ktedonosporobacter rubrisoli TaxID=2509675 RepID=A0A4P6K0G9_KTERU|nr:DUF1579 domain-containing protein [Ktedonosporobacter rubrisoli]QBD81120.1 DUF1579 domain-containing protein [Ktedonosporobacter rubrisoli]